MELNISASEQASKDDLDAVDLTCSGCTHGD